jgi:DNA-binding transcriptional MerR regulator
VARRLRAALFGVTTYAVKRWAAQEKLVFIRTPGGHRRYPEKAILALRQKTGGAP